MSDIFIYTMNTGKEWLQESYVIPDVYSIIRLSVGLFAGFTQKVTYGFGRNFYERLAQVYKNADCVSLYLHSMQSSPKNGII